MRLFSYIVVHDSGFSPNPFWSYCTLACCKPVIRRTAEVGDWIVGLTRKDSGNKLIYAMRVDEILSYEKYFYDPRYVCKKPDYNKGAVVYKCGDNIYEPSGNGDFRQVPSMHYDFKKTQEDLYLKQHDLGGCNALVSSHYFYFGSKPLVLPEYLDDLKVRRGHKNRFSEKVVTDFLEFIHRQGPGVNNAPNYWSANDYSWR